MNKLELQSIGFSYNGKQVLHQFNLSVPAKSKLALMGASGAGKTTILRLIAGLEQPESGSITGLPADGVSMVFQEDRLLPWLTVTENIRLAARYLPTEQIHALLAELGLYGEENRYPTELSGGMKRRIAIARALACRRELLLMDEPFKGLDEQTRRQTMQTVLRHTAETTVLLVTHDREEAEFMGMRIVELTPL